MFQVLRQSDHQEKFCVIVKARPGHDCEFSWVVVSIIQWAAVPRLLADTAYSTISQTVARDATQTERGCMGNNKKTCACQGEVGSQGGASYTFGCSWCMYNGGLCKFGNSNGLVRKFRLKNKGKIPGPEETQLENICGQLADCVSSVFQQVAPACYNNMTLFSDVAEDCRIGSGRVGKPFSGVTVVSDFCAHQHKDINNMVGGCTVVLSLTRPENRDNPQPDDEQFHVLSQYEPDATPEELRLKEETGGLEILKKFQRTIVIREPEEKKCLRGKPSIEKKKLLDGGLPNNYSPSPKKSQKKDSPRKKLARHDLDVCSKLERENSAISAGKEAILENNNVNSPQDLTLSPAPQHYSYTLPSQPVLPCPQYTQYPPYPPYPQFQQESYYHYPVYPPYLPVSFYLPPQHQEPSYSYTGPSQPHHQLQNLNQLENLFSPEMLSLLDPATPPHSPLPQVDGATEENNDHGETPFEVKQEVKFETELAAGLTFDESELKAELKPEVKYETDCSEAIQDPEVGGLALALPHGSLLVEVAKQELHATTALRSPNKIHPCRVGLVFYQHGNLNLPQHGKAKTERKNQEREFRDYLYWLAGWSIRSGERKYF